LARQRFHHTSHAGHPEYNHLQCPPVSDIVAENLDELCG
jgi:hypothetical protein